MSLRHICPVLLSIIFSRYIYSLKNCGLHSREGERLTEAIGNAITGYARLNKSAVVAATAVEVDFAFAMLRSSERRSRRRKFKDSGVDRNISFLNPVWMHALQFQKSVSCSSNQTQEYRADKQAKQSQNSKIPNPSWGCLSFIFASVSGDDGNEAILILIAAQTYTVISEYGLGSGRKVFRG